MTLPTLIEEDIWGRWRHWVVRTGEQEGAFYHLSSVQSPGKLLCTSQPALVQCVNGPGWRDPGLEEDQAAIWRGSRRFRIELLVLETVLPGINEDPENGIKVVSPSPFSPSELMVRIFLLTTRFHKLGQNSHFLCLAVYVSTHHVYWWKWRCNCNDKEKAASSQSVSRVWFEVFTCEQPVNMLSWNLTFDADPSSLPFLWVVFLSNWLKESFFPSLGFSWKPFIF